MPDSNAIIDRILACPSLPSLPAVAVQVLELTRDPDVPLGEIARVVENDLALTSKILRTVNSSYYGLSQPCPTIGRALAYLGLSTVKTLVLSFSVVECVKQTDGQNLDLEAFWRRVIFSAAGARAISNMLRVADPDETFIGALLQDIGMLAMHTALGMEYDVLVIPCMDDHAALSRMEMQRLGASHAEVGALLAERWKLPQDLVDCIRYHDTPDDAPPEHINAVRVVYLASQCAAALIDVDPDQTVNDFGQSGKEWFDMDPALAPEIFRAIGEGAKDLANMFEVQPGEEPDLDNVRQLASELLLQHQAEVARHQTELQQASISDGLTGVANRAHFDDLYERSFGDAIATGEPLAVIMIDLDKFKSVNDLLGHQAGDTVLIQMAARVEDLVSEFATLARYGGEEFVILVPKANRTVAANIGEIVRRHLHTFPIDLSNVSCELDALHVSASIGVAAMNCEIDYDSTSSMLKAADDALYAAKKRGRNRVVTDTQLRTGARRDLHVLLLEHDALAASLLSETFAARGDLRLQAVESIDEATSAIAECAPDFIVIGLSDAIGTGDIQTIKDAANGIACVVLTDDEIEPAGADHTTLKTDVARDASGWCASLVDWFADREQAAA